jgi:23S rRNA (cytosine1962-C5)-methyltransferase
MNKVYLKRHHRSHPWVFSNEIHKTGNIAPGAIVDIYHGHVFRGKGFYNPHSLIAIRRYSIAEQEFDQPFVETMLKRAMDYRKTFTKENSFRLVYSESDGLPGLIVDQYENCFVIQINCYGMDLRRDLIVASLLRLQPELVYERSDSSLRELEGLDTREGLLYGRSKTPILIQQDDIKYLVDIEHGQKTGFFFDLADIRKKVRQLSGNKRVLDLFCYTGAFSIYAAFGGAHSITGIDSSAAAIDLARENSRINNITKSSFLCTDAFDYLRNNNESYDIIILDPPSFAKSKKALAAARRGYKEINIEAMKRLSRGGVLVTTCCSYNFSEESFQEVIQKAAIDAGIGLRMIGRATQALDHPILLCMPESHYLKCFFLQRFD